MKGSLNREKWTDLINPTRLNFNLQSFKEIQDTERRNPKEKSITKVKRNKIVYLTNKRLRNKARQEVKKQKKKGKSKIYNLQQHRWSKKRKKQQKGDSNSGR